MANDKKLREQLEVIRKMVCAMMRCEVEIDDFEASSYYGNRVVFYVPLHDAKIAAQIDVLFHERDFPLDRLAKDIVKQIRNYLDGKSLQNLDRTYDLVQKQTSRKMRGACMPPISETSMSYGTDAMRYTISNDSSIKGTWPKASKTPTAPKKLPPSTVQQELQKRVDAWLN